MGKERQADEGNLYGRVLQRLTLALEEAERRTGDETGATAELEVGGLTPVLRQHSSKHCKQSPPALRQSMVCALCGTSVHWPEGAGAVACSACGSQLLRARQRLHTYPKH
jgi:LSD1 subclass zinc finger protein